MIKEYTMLKEVIDGILADKIIEVSEVATLKTAIYEDGKVDKEEADALFELNDAISADDSEITFENDEAKDAYQALFVEAITDFVLADEVSPGVVDADEAAYIIEKISGDGALDDAEQALLVSIKEKATSYDTSLEAFTSLVPAEEVVAEETTPEELLLKKQHQKRVVAEETTPEA